MISRVSSFTRLSGSHGQDSRRCQSMRPTGTLNKSGGRMALGLAVCVSLSLIAGAARAQGPSGQSREQKEDICTQSPRSEWLPEAEMRMLAEYRGYRIKTFKVANGSCYEIYGFNRQGEIVEAYFNPVTSRLVRQNIAR